MAGIFKIKALADGFLPIATGVLYTVPALTDTIIKTITLVNTDASPVDVNLYINSSGTNRKIIPSDMQLKAGYSLETDEEYTLEAGDTVRGDADTASVVDFTIHGVEET
jgi:hypothetical protein